MASEDAERIVSSFLEDLPDRANVELQVSTFVVQHASHHRPIALVTSGGTAADLELQSVRCLDNFSTGLRGATSVEEFLKRGYAVLHLWRQGSAAPFARVLSACLGLTQANHGLSVEALGRFFATEGSDGEEDLVQQVLDQQVDPWLTDTTLNEMPENGGQKSISSGKNGIMLHRHIVHSNRLQTALKERTSALKEGRLLTIPFRSIEEYLAKLQIMSTALQDSGSLAILYLAAAVSDYYIPKNEKSQHKIQSKGGQGKMTIDFHPVPKTMGVLKQKWAPNAYLVSFKLETDKEILRNKAEHAVEKYGCHMVIGNLLQTRHKEVWTLTGESTKDVKDWSFEPVTKPAGGDPDALENAIIDFVVQSHFEFISNQGYLQDKSGIHLALQRQKELQDKKRQLQRKAFQTQMQQHALTIAGTVVAVVLSSAINSALQKRAARR